MILERLASEFLGLARTVDLGTFSSYVFSFICNIPNVRRDRNLSSVDRSLSRQSSFRTWSTPVVLNCRNIDLALKFDSSSSFGLAREIYARNVYLRAFEKFDAVGETVADFGGNRGFFSRLAASALNPDRIIYVEPEIRYTEVSQTLLDDYTGDLVRWTGFVGALPPGERKTLLDPAEMFQGKIALLKLDIEGAEQSLFENAGGWLDLVERITMESHPEWCDVGATVDALKKRGFITVGTDALGRSVKPELAMFVYAAREPTFLRPKYRTAGA